MAQAASCSNLPLTSGLKKNTDMKTKSSKQPTKSKSAVQLKDIKPKKNPKAGALNAYVSQVVGEKQGTVKSG